MRRSVVGMELDVGALASAIDSELRAAGNAQRAEKERAYLKSVLCHYGASVPTIRAAAKAVARQYPAMTHRRLVQLVDVLWAKPVHECRMACVELLDLFGDQLGPRDFALLERLLREALTWALVDGLAASVAGSLVNRYPETAAVLDRWATDDDFWRGRSTPTAQ